MLEDTKIRFKNLSVWLKIAVISSYVVGIIYLFYFIVGMILGISGY